MIALLRKDLRWLALFFAGGVGLTSLAVFSMGFDNIWIRPGPIGVGELAFFWWILGALLGLFAAIRDEVFGTEEYLRHRPLSAGSIYRARIVGCLGVVGGWIFLPLLLQAGHALLLNPDAPLARWDRLGFYGAAGTVAAGSFAAAFFAASIRLSWVRRVLLGGVTLALHAWMSMTLLTYLVLRSPWLSEDLDAPFFDAFGSLGRTAAGFAATELLGTVILLGGARFFFRDLLDPDRPLRGSTLVLGGTPAGVMALLAPLFAVTVFQNALDDKITRAYPDLLRTAQDRYVTVRPVMRDSERKFWICGEDQELADPPEEARIWTPPHDPDRDWDFYREMDDLDPARRDRDPEPMSAVGTLPGRTLILARTDRDFGNRYLDAAHLDLDTGRVLILRRARPVRGLEAERFELGKGKKGTPFSAWARPVLPAFGPLAVIAEPGEGIWFLDLRDEVPGFDLLPDPEGDRLRGIRNWEDVDADLQHVGLVKPGLRDGIPSRITKGSPEEPSRYVLAGERRLYAWSGRALKALGDVPGSVGGTSLPAWRRATDRDSLYDGMEGILGERRIAPFAVEKTGFDDAGRPRFTARFEPTRPREKVLAFAATGASLLRAPLFEMLSFTGFLEPRTPGSFNLLADPLVASGRGAGLLTVNVVLALVLAGLVRRGLVVCDRGRRRYWTLFMVLAGFPGLCAFLLLGTGRLFGLAALRDRIRGRVALSSGRPAVTRTAYPNGATENSRGASNAAGSRAPGPVRQLLAWFRLEARFLAVALPLGAGVVCIATWEELDIFAALGSSPLLRNLFTVLGVPALVLGLYAGLREALARTSEFTCHRPLPATRILDLRILGCLMLIAAWTTVPLFLVVFKYGIGGIPGGPGWISLAFHLAGPGLACAAVFGVTLAAALLRVHWAARVVMGVLLWMGLHACWLQAGYTGLPGDPGFALILAVISGVFLVGSLVTARVHARGPADPDRPLGMGALVMAALLLGAGAAISGGGLMAYAQLEAHYGLSSVYPRPLRTGPERFDLVRWEGDPRVPRSVDGIHRILDPEGEPVEILEEYSGTFYVSQNLQNRNPRRIDPGELYEIFGAGRNQLLLGDPTAMGEFRPGEGYFTIFRYERHGEPSPDGVVPVRYDRIASVERIGRGPDDLPFSHRAQGIWVPSAVGTRYPVKPRVFIGDPEEGSIWGYAMGGDTPYFEREPLPGGDRLVALHQRRFANRPIPLPDGRSSEEGPGSYRVFIEGEKGYYLLENGTIVTVSEEFRKRIENLDAFTLAITERDPFAHLLEVRNRKGEKVFEHRFGLFRSEEKAWGAWIIAMSLLRAPLFQLGSFLGTSGDPRLSFYGATFVDPLLADFSRPWLLAMNLALGALLAWLAIRRLARFNAEPWRRRFWAGTVLLGGPILYGIYRMLETGRKNSDRCCFSSRKTAPVTIFPLLLLITGCAATSSVPLDPEGLMVRRAVDPGVAWPEETANRLKAFGAGEDASLPGADALLVTAHSTESGSTPPASALWTVDAEGATARRVAVFLGYGDVVVRLGERLALVRIRSPLVWPEGEDRGWKVSGAGRPLTDNRLVLVDLATGARFEAPPLEALLSPGALPALSEKAPRRLAFRGGRPSNKGPSREDAGILVLDLTTLAFTQVMEGDLRSDPALSPDGRILAVSCAPGYVTDHRLVVTDLESKRILDASRCGAGPCFTPEGDGIVVQADFRHSHPARYRRRVPEGNLYLADPVPAEAGSGMTALTTLERGAAREPAFSPDGRYLVYWKEVPPDENGKDVVARRGFNALHVLDRSTGEDRERLTVPFPEIPRLQWNETGDALIFLTGGMLHRGWLDTRSRVTETRIRILPLEGGGEGKEGTLRFEAWDAAAETRTERRVADFEDLMESYLDVLNLETLGSEALAKVRRTRCRARLDALQRHWAAEPLAEGTIRGIPAPADLEPYREN